MFTKQFVLDLLERLVRTFAQTFLAVWVPAGLASAAGWKTALISAATAALLSLLTSLASSGVGDPGSASMIKTRRRTKKPVRSAPAAPAPAEPVAAPPAVAVVDPAKPTGRHELRES